MEITARLVFFVDFLLGLFAWSLQLVPNIEYSKVQKLFLIIATVISFMVFIGAQEYIPDIVKLIHFK